MADVAGYLDSNETLVKSNSRLAPVDICLAVGYSAVFVVGVTGNVVLLLASALSRKLQTRTSCLIVNLSVSDLLVSAVQPFQIVPILDRPLPEVLCQLTAALAIISIGSSVITIMLIAVNRCVLIIKPKHTYNRVFSSRYLVVMVTIPWLYPLVVFVVPHLTGHGRLGYSALTRLCICDFTHKNANTFVYLVVGTSSIAFGVTFFSYWLIYRHMKKSALKSRSCSMPTEKSCRRHTELVITKNLLCVVCCFVLCVTPFMCVFLAIPFLEGPSLHRVLSVMPYLSLPLVLDSCFNAFIYGWKHPHFRIVIACVLRRRWRDIPEPSRLLARILACNTIDRQCAPQDIRVAKGCEVQSENMTTETNNEIM
ncbi:neuropeptides B/W receptor type 2-like [Diadema antillarum]|uniref:neuropeptides B/W receptor type 2-like n=1 Tax=Diadema antillarum TaxID=105358 RepID=UPI003A88BBED